MASSSSVNLVPGGRSPASVLLQPASGSAALLSGLLSELFTGSEPSSEALVDDMVASRL